MNPRIHCQKAVMTINSLPAAQLINQVENQMSRSPNWQKTDAMEEPIYCFQASTKRECLSKAREPILNAKKISSYKNILSDVSRKDEAGFQCIKQKYISSIKKLKNIQKINQLPVIDEIH